jgi:hypothetical protein
MKLGTGETATPSVSDCLLEHDVSLADALAEEFDLKGLEKIRDAVSREWSIRKVMTETGEDRRTIMSMMDAVDSMDQEAVLDLTSGAPTTLADGLQAYLETLDSDRSVVAGSGLDPIEGVLDALHALLVYPWPEEEATIATHGANASVGLRVEHSDRPNDETFSIYVGGQEAYRGSAAREGAVIAEEVADAVYRAVLARVIGDRPHHVHLNYADAQELMVWLEGADRSGNWRPEHSDRLTVDAVAGGGILIRTAPYVDVTPPRSRSSVDTLQP